MLEESKKYSDLTLHVILATVPQKEEKEFDEQVRKEFFENYRFKSQNYFSPKQSTDYWFTPEDKTVPVLYNPLTYHLLGNFDVAYISLIDNFKFAQRLFEPQLLQTAKSPDDIFSPHNFQSFTGITSTSGENLRSFFYEHLKPEQPVRKYFMAICNLKLNNGFLIGNGNDYMAAVEELINREISAYNTEFPEAGIEKLNLRSFSWFEMSLIMLVDDPKHISKIVRKLRKMFIGQLPGQDNIIKKSLYRSLMTDWEVTDFLKANVFADTQTYIGLHADLINKPADDPFVKAFINEKYDFKTEIEWQVKPGHLHLLAHQLEESELFPEPLFKFEDKYLLMGKSDYFLTERHDNINSNLYLLRAIFSQKLKIFEHVRKIKTRVYFRIVEDEGNENYHKEVSRKVIPLHSALKELGVKRSVLNKIDTDLKALKVSRQIRSKVLKVLSNFNNGIQDIILFGFFLDFRLFIDELRNLIAKEYEDFSKRFDNLEDDIIDPGVAKLEKSLMERIYVFQESFNIRMLNCYQFEDITDFDLDFNRSLQQLLSIYSTAAFEIGNLFYQPEYSFGPLIQLNLKDTVSNYVSINYYVHHLTSPEFVFATLTKEIMNFSRFENADLHNIMESYYERLSHFDKPDILLNKLLFEEQLVDLNYYLIDANRFLITYNGDFELFHYWFWSYNLQNASLFDQMGTFNEQHFRKEMFRIMFLNRLFNKDIQLLKCPLPEMYNYWERYYDGILRAVNEYLSFLNEQKFTVRILDYILGTLDKALAAAMVGCTVRGGSLEQAKDELNKLCGGRTIALSRPLRENYARKKFAYQSLPNETSRVKVPKDSLLYLQWYMYNYLKTIFSINKEISFLRRDWQNGKPLVSFIHNHKEEQLYYVDQTGGLFFDDMSKLNDYFKLTSMVLSDLWDFSLTKRKHLILEKAVHKK